MATVKYTITLTQLAATRASLLIEKMRHTPGNEHAKISTDEMASIAILMFDYMTAGKDFSGDDDWLNHFKTSVMLTKDRKGVLNDLNRKLIDADKRVLHMLELVPFEPARPAEPPAAEAEPVTEPPAPVQEAV